MATSIFLAVGLGSQTISASSSGTQVGATALAFGVNSLDDSPAGPGYTVRLPVATGSGELVRVTNRGIWSVVVYPEVGGIISNYPVNGGYVLFPIQTLDFRDAGAGQWDFGANLPFLYPIYRNITAHAGGGQGSAQLIGYGTNWIGTCATAGDSILLPQQTGGCEAIVIFNDGAASCDVFPQSGSRINSLANNTAVAIAAGTSKLFIDIGPTDQWISVG